MKLTITQMFVNRPRLLGCLAEEGISKKELAIRLGISYARLCLKFKNEEFTENEIQILRELFGEKIFLW